MSSENILFAAGRSFVHTYYKLMFQDPLVLHKLYKSESNLSITLKDDEKPNIAQGTTVSTLLIFQKINNLHFKLLHNSQEIKNQIEALKLKLPLVLVKVVDVLPTSNDCILISVIIGIFQKKNPKIIFIKLVIFIFKKVVGTLQNEGEKPKQFHDTFVLAPQKPQGYFIRSHISRYLDIQEG
jgi:hypothetical protein